MKNIICYLKTYLFYLILLIIYLLIVSIYYYFEIINYKTISIINYIVNLILFFIIGFKISKIKHKRGYFYGFLSSVILVIIFSIITLIISNINVSNIVYYLSLIISSMIGGIIGVTK